MNREIGAAIGVQANAMRVLEYFGYNEDNLQGVDFVGVSSSLIFYHFLTREKTMNFSSTGGEVKETINLTDLPDITGGRVTKFYSVKIVVH